MDDFTPSQIRSMELMGKIFPIIDGEEANAVAGALTIILGMAISKYAKTESQAVRMAGQFGGDISRHALDFMKEGHRDV
jgi:hypothetical protein